MFLYGIVYNLTYRDLEEEFRISKVLRKALNLKDVPHYVRGECKVIGRRVRSFGSGLYWVKGRQCELLLCKEEWKDKEEFD